jgi:hypothetical protein
MQKMILQIENEFVAAEVAARIANIPGVEIVIDDNPVRDFEQKFDTTFIPISPEEKRAVLVGLEDAKAGRTISFEDVRAKFRKKWSNYF